MPGTLLRDGTLGQAALFTIESSGTVTPRISGCAFMSSSATPDTILSGTRIEVLETLKSGASGFAMKRRLQERANQLASIDAATTCEWRAYVSAIDDSFDDADESFDCARRLKPGDPYVIVRWLEMLCVTGQVSRVKEKFAEFRSSLDGDHVAMGAVIHVLGFVGLLHDAFHLRERLVVLGGNPCPDVIGGEFWIGAPPKLGIAKPPASKQYPDPWPLSSYRFSLADAEEILTDQGLSIDAWSEPIGCALRFLRRRGLKVAAVRSSFIPHLDGPSSMHFQLIVQAEPDVCWDAEWEFCGVLVDESFPVIDSGAASIAFIPTLLESSSANVA